MRIIGIICIAISALTILYCRSNYDYNMEQMEEHPWVTIFSGGTNLEKLEHSYSFVPPLCGFEVTIYALGGIGILLTIFAPSKD